MFTQPRIGIAGDPDSSWRLVADIGGTNARFALADDYGALRDQESFGCEQFADPAEAVRHYLSKRKVGSVRAAALAVATPVYDDYVAFTNRSAWSFSIRDLGQRLGVKNFQVINDFTALALSVPRLDRHCLIQIGERGQIVQHAPKAVIGPGTGLGVSGVFYAGGRWNALDSEGGHVTMSANSEREAELLRILRQRFEHVSAERILSGPGLLHLYEASCELEGLTAEALTPPEITQRGMADQDDIHTRVMGDFCAMLGTITGNLALTLGARGGTYLGGGILPRLHKMLEQSRFRERFEGHGRLTDYLARIPCYIITARYPALEGALASLDKL